MNNLYFMTDGIITRSITSCCDYLLNDKCNDIYILSENHTSKEEWIKNLNKNVIISKKFSKKINDDDLLIYSNNNLNNESNFKTIKICNYIPKVNNIDLCKIQFYKPRICIISLGKVADSFPIELFVNKVITDQGMKPFQVFSPITNSILYSINENELLNSKIINNNLSAADFYINYIDGNEYKKTIDLLNEIYNFSPNCIFICFDNDFDNDSIIDIIKKTICKNCFTFNSPYIKYESESKIITPVYYETKLKKDKVSIYNKDIENIIKKILFENFYFPTWIRPI